MFRLPVFHVFLVHNKELSIYLSIYCTAYLAPLHCAKTTSSFSVLSRGDKILLYTFFGEEDITILSPVKRQNQRIEISSSAHASGAGIVLIKIKTKHILLLDISFIFIKAVFKFYK